MNKRNLVILMLCCVPTIAITFVMAHRYAADEPATAGLTDAVSGQDEIRRVEARAMQPGEPFGPASVVAVVSYAGTVAHLPETAAVFVFARRSGERMPVAVERFAPTQLPAEVVFRSKGGEALEIVARLTRLGGARLEEGDVESVIEVVAPAAGEIGVELRLPSS